MPLATKYAFTTIESLPRSKVVNVVVIETNLVASRASIPARSLNSIDIVFNTTHFEGLSGPPISPSSPSLP